MVSLSQCVGGEQQQAAKCAEEGYGAFQSISYRTLGWLVELAETRKDFIIAAATVAIAIFTLTLWRSTDKLWDAGDAQLTHAKRTAERQLRAYVGIDSIYFQHLQADKPISVIIVIKNFGLTPAYEYEAAIHLECRMALVS
jgi:hypothetical protein